MIQQGKYNTQGQKNFSDRLAEDLGEWLTEVRHHSEEELVVQRAIQILQRYGNKS